MQRLHSLSQSILVRLSVGMSLVTLTATAVIVGTVTVSEFLAGKGAAINLAGSLRMQSYQLATVAAIDGASLSGRLAAVDKSLAEFERRLHHPDLIAALPTGHHEPLRATYEGITANWRNLVRPHALAAARGDMPRAHLVAEIDGFVRELNGMVSQLEERVENRVALLRVIQGAGLVLIAVVAFAMFYVLRSDFARPLADLLRVARAVRAGNFDARASHTRDDEIGQLGQAFNVMVADLAKLYSGLEARVNEKTAALARSRRSLELLYRTTSKLAARRSTREVFKEILDDMAQLADIQAATICTHGQGHGQSRGYVVAHGPQGDALDHYCAAGRCGECLKSFLPHDVEVEPETMWMRSIPLIDNGRTYGTLAVGLRHGDTLSDWQMQLLEAVARHLAIALSHRQREEDRHRLSLMEERSIIARELHDSLAQSLAYLKIQVARLLATKDPLLSGTASDILAELRAGLNNAYRQLRELLTTFRLKMDGRGLAAALDDTARDFQSRTGVVLRLTNRLVGPELSPHEEIHVLQVVREALSNIEHHAQARHAWVRLASDMPGRITLSVDDDGVGIVGEDGERHHYGIEIMKDRAAILGGQLDVHRRSGGGTRVAFTFTPSSAIAEASPERTGSVLLVDAIGTGVAQ